MRLLDRYLLRELLVPLGFCLCGFLIFWITFDLFGRLDDFQEWHYTLLDVAEEYLLRLPELLNTVLPVALMLALLYTLTNHSRYNELIAMRAAGISLWRICLPYFAVGLLFSVALSLINERLLTDAPARLEQLKHRRLQPDLASRAQWRQRVNFRNQTAQRDWSVGELNLDTTELRQTRVLMILPAGAYREVTADTAYWTNGYWRLVNGLEFVFRSDDDPLPAQKPWTSFSLEEMAGDPARLALWDGTPVVVSNVVVALTNLSHGPDDAGRKWAAASLNLTNAELTDFKFRMPLGVGARRLLMAESGFWTNGHWRFLNAREFLYRSRTNSDMLDEFHLELDTPEFNESPAMIRSEVRVSELLSKTRTMSRPELPVGDILDYLELHPDLSRKGRDLLETQLHARIAAPWTCLVVVLIAIPFGAPSGRRNIFYGVAGSLAWGFLYFTVQRMGFALGQSGLAPPWLGAWLPNASFAAFGLWLTARVR